MFSELRSNVEYAVIKGIRDFLVAGLGVVAITYGFEQFGGPDFEALPAFVATLAVWRVVRGYVLPLVRDVLDSTVA